MLEPVLLLPVVINRKSERRNGQKQKDRTFRYPAKPLQKRQLDIWPRMNEIIGGDGDGEHQRKNEQRFYGFRHMNRPLGAPAPAGLSQGAPGPDHKAFAGQREAALRLELNETIRIALS